MYSPELRDRRSDSIVLRNKHIYDVHVYVRLLPALTFSLHEATQPSLQHTHTHTHTYCQVLSICELRGEAMKVCNDATWQPIKPERDEDAIRLSSTLELVPAKQMEAAKEEEVYFWRERVFSGWVDDFCADIWHDIRWLRADDYCVWSAVSSCICSRRLDSTAGVFYFVKDKLKIKFPSDRHKVEPLSRAVSEQKWDFALNAAPEFFSSGARCSGSRANSGKAAGSIRCVKCRWQREHAADRINIISQTD